MMNEKKYLLVLLLVVIIAADGFRRRSRSLWSLSSRSYCGRDRYDVVVSCSNGSVCAGGVAVNLEASQ